MHSAFTRECLNYFRLKDVKELQSHPWSYFQTETATEKFNGQTDWRFSVTNL